MNRETVKKIVLGLTVVLVILGASPAVAHEESWVMWSWHKSPYTKSTTMAEEAFESKRECEEWESR